MSDEEARQQEIGGMYSELGVTSGGDKLAYMYDMNPGLDYPIAMVYEEEFELLPQYVRVMVEQASVNDDVKNPTKAEAESRGKMLAIEPPFTATIKKKGKKVDWQSVQVGPAASQPAQQAAGMPAGPYVWEPLTPEQWGLAKGLARDVTGLQLLLANEFALNLAEDVGQDDEDQFAPETILNLTEAAFRSSSYEFAKVWPSVRGALVQSSDDALGGTLDSLVIAVQEAEEDEFLATLAEHHPLLVDDEFVKVVLKTVGETGIKKDVDGRVLQARKVALYIELTSRHGLSKDLAAAMVEQTYDQIPF